LLGGRLQPGWHPSSTLGILLSTLPLLGGRLQRLGLGESPELGSFQPSHCWEDGCNISPDCPSRWYMLSTLPLLGGRLQLSGDDIEFYKCLLSTLPLLGGRLQPRILFFYGLPFILSTLPLLGGRLQPACHTISYCINLSTLPLLGGRLQQMSSQTLVQKGF